MCYSDKTHNLHQRIINEIRPLTKGYESCVYLDLPYHTNLGDLLIWIGTEYFLKEIDLRCTFRNSEETNHRDRIKDNQLIFLHGGGNFGEVWRSHQDTRMDIIQHHLNQRIIMLPQTVWYEDMSLLAKDVEICAQHPDLHLCARDSWSFEFLCKQFPNHIHLVPDMAFCIPSQKISIAKKGTLFVERNDHELASKLPKIDLGEEYDKRDWPTFGDDSSRFSKYYRWSMPRKLLGLIINNEKEAQERFVHDWYLYIWLIKWSKKVGYRLDGFINEWAYRHLINSVLDIGTEFLSSYQKVYSTRLHVCILCALMQRSCELIDNNYGKNRHFYQTWLSDIDNIHLLK